MGPVELRVVAFVLQHQPYIAAPEELGSDISRLLGPSSNLSLSDACHFGSILLLDWIWESSCSSAAVRANAWSLSNFLRSDTHYYRWQFARAVTVAAGRGDLSVLTWIFEHFSGCVGPVETVEAAAANGHLAVLKYLDAVGGGRAYSNDRAPDVPLEWNGPGNYVCWGGKSMQKAVENGHADVARWLYSNTPYEPVYGEIDLVICGALKLGDVELAQLFMPPGRNLFDYAFDCPHPDVIELMLEGGHLERNQNASAIAIVSLAAHGRLDLLERVAKIYTPPPTDDIIWLDHWRQAMVEAIKRDDLPLLQWLVQLPSGRMLLENKTLGDQASRMLGLAASNGCVEIMQFLHEEGIADGYEDALVKGVRSGHLHAVKWLLPRVKRPTNENLMDEAAKCGQLTILQYFHSSDSSSRAAATLELIRSKGCTTFAMDHAAVNEYLDVVQWLHFNRLEGCTTEAMDLAAKGGHLHVLQWLHANRSEGCSFKAIEAAISNGHLQVAFWLRGHYPHHFPAMVGKSISSDKTLEVLLFLHVHYPHVFTIWFRARIQRPLVSTSRTESGGLVVQWLETHHPDYDISDL